MTTPTSGPISIGNVATEFSYGLPLSLGDSRMRTIVNTPSGPIQLGQFRGLTAPNTSAGGGGPITPPPPNNPAAGTLLSTYCSGTTLMGTYANGSGGTYNQTIQTNSAQCGYVNPNPPYGTNLGSTCVGQALYGIYADGSGGTYTSLIDQYSIACGYVPPPPAGTYLGQTCLNGDLYDEYATGSGGTTFSLNQPGSPYCAGVFSGPPNYANTGSGGDAGTAVGGPGSILGDGIPG